MHEPSLSRADGRRLGWRKLGALGARARSERVPFVRRIARVEFCRTEAVAAQRRMGEPSVSMVAQAEGVAGGMAHSGKGRFSRGRRGTVRVWQPSGGPPPAKAGCADSAWMPSPSPSQTRPQLRVQRP
jgi:hypothetical protein